MPEIIARSADNPEFPRMVMMRQLRDVEVFDFDITPTPDEAAALARLMGALSLRKMHFVGRLTPGARGRWELSAKLGATVVQPCVVSLEPVTTRIDQPVRRLFVPDDGARAAEIVLKADEDDDETEPLGDHIDLGLVATEALALALPAYPRKPDATLPGGLGRDGDSMPGEGAGDGEEGDTRRPFAALAALRAKMEDKA